MEEIRRKQEALSDDLKRKQNEVDGIKRNLNNSTTNEGRFQQSIEIRLPQNATVDRKLI